MRVLALDLGPSRRGGQRQTLLVSQVLAREGATVGVVSLAGSPLADDVETSGGRLALLPVRHGSEASPGLLLDVARAARRFRPQVLWAGDSRAHGAAVWSRLHHRYPLTVHRRVAFPPGQNLLSRIKYAAPRRYFAVSGAVAAALRDAGVPGHRIRLVPDGLPPEAFVDRPRYEGPPHRLVHAGAFDGKKGQRLAVEVLALLRSAGRDVHLVLLGDGPERKGVEALAERLGVRSACDFRGEVPGVASELAAAHVLLLPSESEGAPLVLTEAMAAGCSAVAHDVGGASELLEGGRAGVLVDGLDPLRWAERIAALLDDSPGRAALVAEGRRAASERTLARTAAALARELSEVIEEHGRQGNG